MNDLRHRHSRATFLGVMSRKSAITTAGIVMLMVGCGDGAPPPVTAPAPAGSWTATLQASPNPVPEGSSSTTITWDSGKVETAGLYVAQDGGPEKLLSQDRKGSKEVNWISKGSYEFRLYAGKDRETTLASIVVTRGGPANATPEKK